MSQGYRGLRGNGEKGRILHRLEISRIYFLFFELRDLFARGRQPERQFPKNPGLRKRSLPRLETIRGFQPLPPLLPRYPWDIVARPRNPWDIVARLRYLGT
jgi:hypothetical protein